VTGVNVTGYLRTESGVGDLARRYVRALRALDVPLSLTDVSQLSGNRAEDRALDSFVPPAQAHDVNLVCIDVHQHYALFRERGTAWLDGRYNIGVWLWELEQFPEKWRDRFAYYDEIWAPSSFIANALAPISPVPVVTMPAVLTPAARGSRERGRARIGAGADDFVFLFIFDVNSTMARKNPLAVIEAFTQASRGVPRARLVLKFVNGASDADGVRELAAAAAGHDVTLIDTYWPASDVRDLLEACDAYVSLHRSEGLGLTVTDAMALGKPVVATDWSGSRDFLNARNGFPVAYELVASARKAGPYPAGSVWAEPSIADAAGAMRAILEGADAAGRRAAAARRDIDASYSEHAVAARIRARFEAIASRRRGDAYRDDMRDVYRRYERLSADLAALVERHVPEAAAVAVISKGDDRLLDLGGRRASHFPQLADGRYAGYHPHDSHHALAQLEAAQARGIDWLVIPRDALWWLEHYPQFAEYLRRSCDVAGESAAGTVVRLRAGVDVFGSGDEDAKDEISYA
jgi:glycosyltransferase involved in cell wall biosynthesis